MKFNDSCFGFLHIFAWLVLAVLGKEELNSKIRFATDKGWTTWSSWSSCTSKHQTCYSGSQTRHRSCSFRNHCSGIYVESRDCPRYNCSESRKQLTPISDVSPASYSSFISQECDTDIKYSLRSSQAKNIPKAIKIRFKLYADKFNDGYFNRKFLLGSAERHLKNMTKYCFEPSQMSPGQAMQLSYFNRTSRSSLYSERKASFPGHGNIAGVAIVLDDRHNLTVVYFAVPSSNLGYKKVYYRRWKGTGFEDAV